MSNAHNRLPVSAEEALRNKQRVSLPVVANGVSIKRPLPPVANALVDTTNLPSKRLRLLDSDKNTSDNRNIISGMKNDRKVLVVAPDWGGGEATSTAIPFNDGRNVPSTQMLPPAPTPVGFRDITDPLSLSHPNWGLKREIVIGFASCNISSMYPWQLECLSLPGLLTGEQNLVYTAPTSAGKSLIADILAIRKVVIRRKKAIIVVPYIAIVYEKTKFLKKVLDKAKVQAEKKGEWDKSKRWRGLNIVGFHSGVRSSIGWEELDVAVCTIEKANALINASIENCTINHLGIMVFDELHMLDDPYRGHILELLATKVLCLCLTEQIQIVGMSATLANVKTLAKWLRAEFYECTYRPIPLLEYFVYENNIYDTALKLTAHIPSSEIKELEDPVTNSIIILTFECVKEDHGVLVFCESRKRCEDLALMLVKFMPGCDKEAKEKRIGVISDLAMTTAGLDIVLEKTVLAGVAFHHAGLTTEEKGLIANAYDHGFIKAIFCTATMAAGVNLPVRRVIISPRMGRDFISPAMLRQMKGRAGRKGKDIAGENYLVCRKEDVESVKAIMGAEMPSVNSCLAGEGGLKRAMLEGIATRLAASTDSLNDFLRTTLLYHTTATPIVTLRPLIAAAIASLEESSLITRDEDTGYFIATKIGNATVASGFGPDEGIFIHKELCRALKAFNLESDMHIVYQFTPIHSSGTRSIEVDWRIMRDEVEKLDEGGLRAATFVGVNPGFVNRMAQGGTLREDTPANIEKARVYRRFYVALMLRELINERPVHIVAESYDIARGFVQQLATTCRSFAATSMTFCKVMGWTGLAVLLGHYSWRLDLGVKDDLMALARIPFVKSFTARVFHENGLKTIEAVAREETKNLVKILEMALPKKVRLREEEEGKLKQRLEERAEIILKASRRMYKQECAAELDE